MSRFYVYHLVDPRDGKVFYVGKGQRTRGNDHVKDIVVHGKDSKHPKDQTIRKIIGAGLDVECKIVKRFTLEADALEFEREQIAEIGLENLTNILSGYESTKARVAKLNADNTPPTAEPTPVPQRGRPSAYTDKLCEEICSQLSEGNSLRSICAKDGMVSMATVMNWLSKGADNDPKYKAFFEQYAQAREAQAEKFVDEIIEIADTEELVDRARVRIDARKWVAGKMKPKKYGDKIQQELVGKDGGPIVTEDRTPIETARRIVFILDKAAREKSK